MEIESRFYVCVIKQEMRLLQVAFLIKESNGEKKGRQKYAYFSCGFMYTVGAGEKLA